MMVCNVVSAGKNLVVLFQETKWVVLSVKTNLPRRTWTFSKLTHRMMKPLSRSGTKASR